MHRFTASALILALAGLSIVQAEDDKRDTLFHKGNPQARRCYVFEENRDKTLYKTWETQPSFSEVNTRDVAEVIYYGMTVEGPWKSGIKERASGQYLVAAERFNQLATTGERQWEKAYGWFNAGDAFEQAGEFARAAESFAKLPATFPSERRFLDAYYRQGICLARAKKSTEAQAVVKILNDWYEANAKDRAAKARAIAITAADLGEQGKLDRAEEEARKVVFSKSDGETTLHWGLYWANLLRTNNLFDKAATQYKNLLALAAGEAAIVTKCSLGYGVCLAKTDKERALIELLKMDALPYGSPTERAEAQFTAGVILWETAQEAIKSKGDGGDEKRVEFAQDKLIQGREMLKGVAENAAAGAFQQKAQDYLATLPPDPEEEKAKAEAAAKEAEATKAAEGKAGDAKAGEKPAPK